MQSTRETELGRFGAVGGQRLSGGAGLYRIDTVIEKPTPTEAEQRLIVSGLRAGYYLCFFGMHVLTPAVMEILAALGAPRRPPLSAALAELARREQYLALESRNRRYDVGARYGLLSAQLALALAGQDRDEVLSQLVELLAAREMGSGGPPGMSRLVAIITAADPAARDRSLDAVCRPADAAALLAESAALDAFRRSSDNLYERVRALFFLYAIHRFHLPAAARPARRAASSPSTATSTC